MWFLFWVFDRVKTGSYCVSRPHLHHVIIRLSSPHLNAMNQQRPCCLTGLACIDRIWGHSPARSCDSRLIHHAYDMFMKLYIFSNLSCIYIYIYIHIYMNRIGHHCTLYLQMPLHPSRPSSGTVSSADCEITHAFLLQSNMWYKTHIKRQ